ncbi:hypothetical protein M407DRAFT_22779 [Tulasnella calospora MUT 4182]|uniref:F-box domain-containing protein n=1 Tax=Tulasnella calospora MUT 4182 TaxID=1051891 RepID=A0A0C3QME8_9AGAM|nr:hypothetical protein M407DRAFT_22779 [Tulasnella calospora MUT 4182]
MHDALRIPELFVNIFSFLNASDLLSCALVCKLWSEDAQIARWKVCNVTLKALLQRLAPLDGLDELGLPDEVNGQYSTLRINFKDISSQDWEGFLSTTGQVTHLHVTRPCLHPSSVTLLQSLLSTYGGDLFPNLKSLELDFDAIEVPTVGFALSPSLRTFKATSYGYDDLGAIFYRLHPHSTNIDTVDLWMERGSSRFQGQFYPNLRILKYACKSFTGEAWAALADAPLLEDLDISVYMSDIPIVHDVTFPALKRLHMEDMEAGLTLALMLGSHMPVLEAASMEEIPLRKHHQSGLRQHLADNSPVFKGIAFVDVEETDEGHRSLIGTLLAVHPLLGFFLSMLRFLFGL